MRLESGSPLVQIETQHLLNTFHVNKTGLELYGTK
jgi:hypothetical protein